MRQATIKPASSQVNALIIFGLNRVPNSDLNRVSEQ